MGILNKISINVFNEELTEQEEYETNKNYDELIYEYGELSEEQVLELIGDTLNRRY